VARLDTHLCSATTRSQSAAGGVALFLLVIRGTMSHVTCHAEAAVGVSMHSCVCGLLLPAVMTWWLRVHLRETERGRQQAVRMQTEVLALRAGETFVGVIDRRHGPAIFLVHDMTDGRNDA
jgi:hypothetical protein